MHFTSIMAADTLNYIIIVCESVLSISLLEGHALFSSVSSVLNIMPGTKQASINVWWVGELRGE